MTSPDSIIAGKHATAAVLRCTGDPVSTAGAVDGGESVDLATTTLSVIIPSLNEEKYLPGTLSRFEACERVEVILADGGSTDRTCQIARGSGARLVCSARGRARQMNAAAKEAKGGILLFLHADTHLPVNFSELIRDALGHPGVSGGAFALRIDGPNPSLRVVERFVQWRSRWLGLPYGDQALFMKAEVFVEVGGFPDIPIMEDFEMARRLRKRGKLVIVPEAVTTSARRWLKGGIWRTTLRNQLIIAGYKLGIDPTRLARWRGGELENSRTREPENSRARGLESRMIDASPKETNRAGTV